MKAAQIARKFAPSRRREVVSLSHHAEVVGLPEGAADDLLDWAGRSPFTAALSNRSSPRAALARGA